MRVKIDNAGRIVLPKRFREALSLRGGDALDVELTNGTIELQRPPRQVKLVKGRHGLLVASPDSGIPASSLDEILEAIDEARP
ncbi:MAG: hypothetical protein QOJ38_1816 [Solirubrobacterales bacterium]|jgi:AbrB family looped-hinge helix DNA binding protein|nr:hypothetical protein [Solirubrobacterales bacterium]